MSAAHYIAKYRLLPYNYSMSGFPKDFLWGAATSAHQVEGNNYNNDWWAWEQSGGTEASGLACDHYSRFREDFQIAKDLNHNAHRLGIEWSRIEKYEGSFDQKEWDHYKAVLDELIRLEIEPIVTLHHFTLPAWISRKGGWLNEATIDFFTRFARNAIKELGDRVRFWIPVNEPMVLAFIGYLQGNWPPHKKSFASFLDVTKNMLLAHVSAYGQMKDTALQFDYIKSPRIGVAKAVAAFHPCRRNSILDRLSAKCRTNFQDHSFVSSLIKGKMDFFPYIHEKLHSKNTVDFIGLNYYFREFVHHKKSFLKNPLGFICSRSHHKKAGPRTDMGWEIYPEGLYEVVRSFSKYKKPILITENGISTKDDDLRKEYIKGHLTALLKAVDKGAPVIGYMHWSLLDNFEWAEGYKQRFGLVEVDHSTQKRTIKGSAEYYAGIIRTGKIPG